MGGFLFQQIRVAQVNEFRQPRLPLKVNHGTACTLTS